MNMTKMDKVQQGRKGLHHPGGDTPRGCGCKRDFVSNNSCDGFTLIEAIMVIVITGVIAGMVAVFIQKPVQAYFDISRRAEMTDVADTALRRMARDIQSALPNSVRVDASGAFLEFLPIKGAGRYCAESGTVATWTSTACTDALNIGAADTSFYIMGPLPVPAMAAGDSIVVYNLGIAGADAYTGETRTTYTSLAGNIVTMASKTFPLDSPGKRFQVISTPVSYVCDGTTSRLLRYAGYAIQAGQPTTLAALNALVAPAVLATNATCTLAYTPGFLQDMGLVTISLTITQSGESVTLQHEVNVVNTP